MEEGAGSRWSRLFWNQQLRLLHGMGTGPGLNLVLGSGCSSAPQGSVLLDCRQDGCQLLHPWRDGAQHRHVCGPKPSHMDLPQPLFEPVTGATCLGGPGSGWGARGRQEGQRDLCSLSFQLRPSAGVK